MFLEASITSSAARYSEGAPSSPLLSSRPRGWHGLVVELFRHPPAEVGRQTYAEHLITLYLGDGLRLRQVKGGRRHEGPQTRGDLTLSPAGEPNGWRWDREAFVLNLFIEPGLLQEIAASEMNLDPQRVELIRQFSLRDPLVEQIGLALLEEVRSGGAGGRLFADSLANVLAIHLLRRYSTLGGRPSRGAGGLTPRRLRRAVEYIHEHLAGDLRLSGMAAAAGLSEWRFARLFKQSTGLSPHRYVNEQRIARAKNLLAGAELPIVEVALRSGFQSQSHFTALFRRLTGTTPRAFRERGG